MAKSILLMYSGGLDSLGTLYKLLTEKEYKGYTIHVHHIHQHNVENRAQAENVAVNLALEELTRLGFKFVYSDSKIQTPSFGKSYMYDTDSVNFMAGYICSVDPSIEIVAMGMQADDANQSLEGRRKRANALLAAFTNVKKIFPVLNLTKREIYDTLPDTLRDLFWSCRTPVYENTAIKPCGKCKTCLQLTAAGIR